VRGDLTLSKKGQDETFVQVGISAFPRSDSAGVR
jgi:hypothetical protein